MLFNSIEFLLFLPTVFILYWFVFNKNLKHQNLLILISSYVFYGWWDYRFLSLILLSTIVDYFVGLGIQKETEERKRKYLLWVSVLFNLGILGFFKYYNFFVDSWIDLFNSVGYEIQSTWTLYIILPVGISFYTFQTMSYTIDVYRRNLEPTKDFIAFAFFVAFFPQLVAGPIEKAKNLLPQILNKREFEYKKGIQGLRLIIWGLFQKVAIADTLAPKVDDIFGSYQLYEGSTLWLGAIYFGFQIYCDFSGYSNIAVGIAKLFGIEITPNFNFPYFSRNIVEFWRRWHISLTNWFTEYLYIPLKIKTRNFSRIGAVFVTLFYFAILGLWHGANWTFIFWGLLHGVYLIPFILNPSRKFANSIVAENSSFPSVKELFQMVFTFILVTITYVFFRSESLIDSLGFLERMFFTFNIPNLLELKYLFFVFLILFIDWRNRFDNMFEKKKFRFEILGMSILFLYVVSLIISSENKDFIYFDF